MVWWRKEKETSNMLISYKSKVCFGVGAPNDLMVSQPYHSVLTRSFAYILGHGCKKVNY